MSTWSRNLNRINLRKRLRKTGTYSTKETPQSSSRTGTGREESLVNWSIHLMRYQNDYYMSCPMEKPTICIGENKDADQLRGNREADQRLCFRYKDSTIPLLAFFCACTAQFVSDLFGNLIVGFTTRWLICHYSPFQT